MFTFHKSAYTNILAYDSAEDVLATATLRLNRTKGEQLFIQIIAWCPISNKRILGLKEYQTSAIQIKSWWYVHSSQYLSGSHHRQYLILTIRRKVTKSYLQPNASVISCMPLTYTASVNWRLNAKYVAAKELNIAYPEIAGIDATLRKAQTHHLTHRWIHLLSKISIISICIQAWEVNKFDGGASSHV